MNTYGVTITRYDEDGNPTELADKYITADQAIDLMLQVNEMAEYTIQEDEEESIDEEDPVEEDQSQRKVRRCGNCGEPGHNAKTCPKDRAESDDSADEEEDDLGGEDPFVAQMVRMLRGGKSEHDIYNDMHDSLTDAQFREKFEAAKGIV